MKTHIGTIQKPDGNAIWVYWNRQSHQVFIRPEKAVLRVAFENIGSASDESKAMDLVKDYLRTDRAHWN